MNRQDHLTVLRSIVQRLVLIPKPDQLVLTVTLTDINAELDQSLIHNILESIRFRSIGSTLNRNCPLVIGITGRTPGTVLFLNIHPDTPILVDAVITGCLCAALCEPVSQTFRCTLTHNTMRRDSVNRHRPLPGMVRTQLRISHHRTVRVCHYSSPSFFSSSFSALSWSCSNTLCSFVGIGSPRYAAFSTSDNPSLEI